MQFYSGPLMHFLSGVDNRPFEIAGVGIASTRGGINTGTARQMPS
jgi:hypothetical protein